MMLLEVRVNCKEWWAGGAYIVLLNGIDVSAGGDVLGAPVRGGPC